MPAARGRGRRSPRAGRDPLRFLFLGGILLALVGSSTMLFPAGSGHALGSGTPAPVAPVTTRSSFGPAAPVLPPRLPADRVTVAVPTEVPSGSPRTGAAAGTGPQFTVTPSWMQLTAPAVVRDRYGEVLVYDPELPGLLVMGGFNSSSFQAINDTWLYANGVWSQVARGHGPPSGSLSSSAAYDPDLGAVVFADSPYYGGGPNVETWSYSHETWSKLSPAQSPTARNSAQVAYDASDHAVLLFGGSTFSGGGRNDTWLFANGTWTQLSIAAPSPRGGGATFPDPVSGGVLLFGGSSFNTAYNDTWRFANRTWSKLNLTGAPSARTGALSALDEQIGTTIVYGGMTGGGSGLSDQWSLAGGNWTMLNGSAAPGVHTYSAMAYDRAQPGAFLLGGFGGGGGAATTFWSWTAPNASLSITRTSLDLGQRWLANTTARVVAGTLNLTWNFSSTSLGCSDNWTANLVCVPDSVGEYWANLTLTGSNRSTATTSVELEVWSTPTVGQPVPSPTAGEVGETVTFQVSASGGTGTYTGYRWIGLSNATCSGTTSSLATCLLTGPAALTVAATVTDSNGMTSPPGPTVYYLVLAAPTVSTPVALPGAADVGTAVQLTTSASSGSGYYSRYDWTNLTFGTCQGIATAVVQCTAETPGSYAITVVVTDSNGGRSTPSATYVLRVYPALEYRGVNLSSVALDVGGSLRVALDYAGGSPNVTIGWTGLPSGCGPYVTAQFTCTPTVPGTFALQAAVQDPFGTGFSTPTFSITVNPALLIEYFVADPPNVTRNAALNLSLLTAGGTAPFRYAYTGLPPGCSTADRPELICHPSELGAYVVNATVTDASGGVASEVAFLNVTDAPAGGSSGGGLGSTLYLVPILIAAAAVVVAGLLWRRRRRRGPRPPEADPESVDEAATPDA